MTVNWSLLDSNAVPVPESGCWIYMGYLNSGRAMARKYGVSHSSIMKIRRRETWTHIEHEGRQ